MAVEIGALRALLSLDTAAFEKGVKRAQASMNGMQRAFSKTADRLASVGRTMSTRVTAPIVGAMGLMANAAVQNAVEIERLSQVANASTREFQRFAAGARSVGIEQDKVADILKVVNDRVGDFLTTGGGPMKDFFEQIGPKIGVTAEQFKNLSGPEALQLFVSSLEKAGLNQQEMTFYMEAMASDATALIPLLRDNGKEMERLGDSAEKAGAVMDESTIKALNDARVAMRDAGDAVSGLVNQIIASLAPTMEKISEKVRDAARWFNDLSPQMKEMIGIAAAVAAAVGPMAITLGFVAAGLAALASPIGLVVFAFGAVAGAVAAVVVYWDDLVAKYPALQTALDVVGAVAKEVWRIFGETGKAAFDIAKGYVEYFSALLRGDFKGAFEAAQGITERFVSYIQTAFPGVIDTVSRVISAAVTAGADIIEAIKNGITGAISSVSTAIDGLVDSLIQWIKEIPSRVWESAKQAGADIMDGLKQGILGMKSEVGSAGRNVARGLMDETRDEVDSHSPSREFMKIGKDLMDGLGIGIADNATTAAASAAAAAGQVTDAAGKGIEDGKGKVAGVFDDIGSAAAGAITQGQNFGEAMGNVFQNIANDFLSSGISDMLGGLFGGSSAGSGAKSGGVLSSIASAFAGLFDKGGRIPSGKFGIAGENGAEIITGPANVMSTAATARVMTGASQPQFSGGELYLSDNGSIMGRVRYEQVQGLALAGAEQRRRFGSTANVFRERGTTG